MISDHALRLQVLEELTWEPMVNADSIGVTVCDGVVTLSGHVESYWQKRAAETAVAGLRGVRAIADCIEVRLPDQVQRRDDEIAAAVADRLDWVGALPPGAVKVLVEDGFVTLTGIVTHQYQREAAFRAVDPLWGVRGVANQITIRGAQREVGKADRVREEIRRAFTRKSVLPESVQVEEQDGTVTLSGSTRSLRERDIAVAAAWAAHGTTMVEDNIRIE